MKSKKSSETVEEKFPTSAPPLTKLKIITYLIIIGWVIAKYNIPMLSHGHMENLMWSYYGLGLVHIVLGFTSTALLASGLYLFERKMKPGYLIANIYIGLTALIITAEAMLLARDINLARGWYMQSRALRGFPVSEEKAQAVVSSELLMTMLYLTLAALVIIAIVLFIKRHRYAYDFSLSQFIKN